MKKSSFLILLLICVFICSCSKQTIIVNENTMQLNKGSTLIQELNLGRFYIIQSEEIENGIKVEYEYIDDLDEVGYPRYGQYDGELYFTISDNKLVPVLNIVNVYRQTFGSCIKLLNKTEENGVINIEYDFQLYDIARAAGFGTVKISYEIINNPSGELEYKVIDYSSDLISRFKMTVPNDPNSMMPRMDGDIINQIDFPIEEFNKIADQVYEYIQYSEGL